MSKSSPKQLILSAALAAATLGAATAALATPFDLEGLPTGANAGSVAVVDGGLTMTITPEGNPNGFVFIENPSVALLGLRGAIGSQVNPLSVGQFNALRFSFNQAIDSITFNFGDAGGDDDSPVRIRAFDALDNLLGTINDVYPAGFNAGKTQTANFAGASYYVVESFGGQGNDFSIFWDVSAITPGNAVPVPATLALAMLGVAAVVGRKRRA